MRRLWLAVAILMIPVSSAYAQEEEESAPLSAAPLEEKKAPSFSEVEHGFFVGAATGLALFPSPPGQGGSLSVGQSGGIELGFEPTPMIALGVLAWGGNANTSSKYVGTCVASATNSCPHGNFTALIVGADVRLNVAIGADANEVKRLFFTFRAGGGYSLVRPKGLLANEPIVFGGPGIEYFTHLRHFSIGLEADGTYGLTNKGLGIMVQPLVRYSF